MVAFVPVVASAQAIYTPPPPQPFNPPPERSSFTFELGVGMGATSQLASEDNGTRFGVAPWFALGGFVTRNVALLARVSATTYSERNGFTMNAFYGAGAQVWPVERFFLGASIGVAHFRPPAVQGVKVGPGFGANARIGVVAVKLPRSVVSVVLEATPGFFPDRTVVGSSLSLEFQHL